MGSSSRPVWADHVVASRLQSLEDVAVAQMGTVAVLSGDVDPTPIIEALTESALANGFAIATASLAAYGLHDLHALVGALTTSLRVSHVEPGRRNGLVVALDAFAARHGRHAAEHFDASADDAGLAGELRVLAREYVAAPTNASAARKLHAWLSGRDVTLRSETLRTLDATMAKRALVALTRLVRTLGHRGTRILLTDAEALVDLAPARRDVAYTVLREIIDNADSGRGMAACETLLFGTGDLDRRVHSLTDHPALATRIVADVPPGPPIPHQTWIGLTEAISDLPEVPEPRPARERSAPQLRALLRVTQGLPPLEAVPELTIGMEDVDRRIGQLFETASYDASVFAVLTGEYGAGKTHHLLYLEARALEDRRPVLRLAVERLDEDLGNPQRHLRRLVEDAVVPGRRTTGMLEKLERWLSTAASRRRLVDALRAIAGEELEASRAAVRALGDAEQELDEVALNETLGALDLVDKPNNPGYRKDAYARLHLWLELLVRLDDCRGPVIILDEAENLYRPGVSRSERRTALRSLAHYCGGAIPRATVVLAVTPDTLDALREEAGALLDEIEEQATLLPTEDVAMLRRRLLKARPIQVTKLGREELATLAEQARSLSSHLRGRHADRGAAAFLERVVKDSDTPRELLRRVLLREERIAWLGAAGS